MTTTTQRVTDAVEAVRRKTDETREATDSALRILQDTLASLAGEIGLLGRKPHLTKAERKALEKAHGKVFAAYKATRKLEVPENPDDFLL